VEGLSVTIENDPVITEDVLLSYEAYVENLEKLIRWLSLPYGENIPIFPITDVHGQPMSEAVTMRTIYLAVVHDHLLCEIGGCENEPQPGYKRCEVHW
jgi:hypothetical protein